MKALSSLVAALLLSVVAGSGTNLTVGEGNITPYLKNTVYHTLGEGRMLKRRLFDGTLCGRQRAIFNPLKRGENRNNDYDYYSDKDTNETPQLNKVLGGMFTNYGQVPWQASILYRYLFVCSGSIINGFWVLTSARCLFQRPKPTWFKVAVGDHRMNYVNRFEKEYAVDKMFIHERYSANPLDYDIALIKIKAGKNGEGFRFNSYVQPVCLPNANETLRIGSSLTASGWGYTFKDSGAANLLKITTLPVLEPKSCQRLFPLQVTSRNICVGYVNGRTELCEGDTGGPATLRQRLSTVLYGVISFGLSCKPPHLPSILSSVPAYRSWIDTTISSNSVGKEKTMPRRV